MSTDRWDNSWDHSEHPVDGPFGFVVIDKPAGLTSHSCVSRLRRCYGLKRVGHGGTLDPAVTGVLPIALGPATRLLPYLPGDKTYRGVIQLGQVTSSDDLEGELLQQNPWPGLDPEDLNAALNPFRGAIQQRPPQVSAVHVDGERAHARARRGEVMDLPARAVTIHRLTPLHWDQAQGRLELEVHCSAGTYIRSLARDLGESWGAAAAWPLRRTRLGFDVSQAHALPEAGDTTHTPSPLLALGHCRAANSTWTRNRTGAADDGRPATDCDGEAVVATPTAAWPASACRSTAITFGPRWCSMRTADPNRCG